MLPGLRAFALYAGVVGSIFCTVFTGRRNPSWLLLLAFVLWVFLPYVVAGIGAERAKHWAPRARAVLDGTIVAIALGSLALYAAVAFGPRRPKPASFFLITPVVALVVLLAAFALARKIDQETTRPEGRG